MLTLSLPGVAYLYQGEELGLPDHTTLPDEVRQDPGFERSGRQDAGRDGCRIPFPWDSRAPALGFSPTGASWLPQPPSYAELALDRQRAVPGSVYEFHRALLDLRRRWDLGVGELIWIDEEPPGVLAFRSTGARRGDLLVYVTTGPASAELPHDAHLLISSQPLTEDGHLPGDSAAWLSTQPADAHPSRSVIGWAHE